MATALALLCALAPAAVVAVRLPHSHPVPRAPLSAPRAPPVALTATATSCEALLRATFEGVVDADAVADACAPTIEWDDMSAGGTVTGPAAVRELIAAKYPAGSVLVLDKVSDGQNSGGFVFHREAADRPGEVGLRGTLFAELDGDGRLAYVREGCEPIVKPGQATEALLKAATANMERPPKPPPTFTSATPTTASGIVRYLWEEAYPKGAEPTEGMRLFADSIRYEDFNYPEPFVGKPAVLEFVTAFDIPNVEFVPLKISDGDRAVCFTWKVVVNGQDGPSGISFYEVDGDGKVCFIRDIPAPSPRGFRPAAALAAAVDPELRTLSAAKLTSAALGVGSMGMGLLKPIFHKEAELQAELLGGDDARAEAVKRLDEEAASAPVVVYTYALSPFSTECLAFLDAIPGLQYKKIELGLEWFLLDGVGSSVRAELLARHGLSSLPHVFVGGKSVGGLYSGSGEGDSVGLVELKRQGRLEGLLKAAGAL